MSAPPSLIIILGATGVFGQRLLEQLVACGAGPLVLAGRRLEKLEALRDQAAPEATCLVMDRNEPETKELAPFAGGILVDAAGPFQNSGLHLIEACIAAGVHCIDLADARDFVARVPLLDTKAKAACVAVVSGASSTPALSHAVIHELTKGWRCIHSIFVGISPGNRAPRGESVVRAILSYAGAPFKVFDDGGWRVVSGWSGNECRDIPGIGRRNFVQCETPDQDLLVERFHPTASAVFKAGLELGVMHHGLRVLAWLRSIGLLKDLSALTPLLLWVANLLKLFGTDRGGMLVEVTGVDAAGDAMIARWTLRAAQGVGPNVPSLPALALLLRRNDLKPGARAAAGEVTLTELQPHFARLGIHTATERQHLRRPEVFERALGANAWNGLPDVTRAIHYCQPGVVLRGEASISGPSNLAGRMVARLFRFPAAAEKVPVTVSIDSNGEREIWHRRFGDKLMASVMTVADGHHQSVEERFGPLSFRMRLETGCFGLNMVPDGMRTGPVPLPRLLMPEITAEERVDAEDRHSFNVRIAKWPLGVLVHYRGWLQIVTPDRD